MGRKAIALAITVIFLIVSSACSHGPKRLDPPDGPPVSSSGRAVSPPMDAASQDVPWWKKEENQWLILVLAILGVAIAASATIMISSGSGGLRINVQN